jgi:hypothetical protein
VLLEMWGMENDHHLRGSLRLSEYVPAGSVPIVGEQGMYAGFRLHRRLCVQCVFHFVAFLWDREKVGVRYDIEWIARFLRAHPVANRNEVVSVSQEEKNNYGVEDPNDGCSHEMDLPSIGALTRTRTVLEGLVALASGCGVGPCKS